MSHIKVIKYNWNNKGCYLGYLTYGELTKMINFKIDETINRDVNSSRVEDICEYIKKSTINTFFPPIILNTFSKIVYEPNKSEISTKGLSIKIIDGQHRIKAIFQVISEEYEKYTDYKIPFLLIEELSPIISRDIFNLVNTYQAKVQDNVAERLTPSIKCNILLKYIAESENTEKIKEIIEWNEKQSDRNGKVVFNHITFCIDILDKALVKKNEKYKNNKVRYKEYEYYNYFNIFLTNLFNFYLDIDISNEKNHFWITKATLSAITKLLIKRIKTCKTEEIEECINNTLNEYLIKELVFDYSGKFNTRNDVLNKILIYLTYNKLLNNKEIPENDCKLLEFRSILTKGDNLEENFEYEGELI